MKNLFDIQCPQCGGSDSLNILSDEGDWGYLGPYMSPEEAAEVARGTYHRDSPVGCDNCCHEGRFDSFDGFEKIAAAARERLNRLVMLVNLANRQSMIPETARERRTGHKTTGEENS